MCILGNESELENCLKVEMFIKAQDDRSQGARIPTAFALRCLSSRQLGGGDAVVSAGKYKYLYLRLHFTLYNSAL